ncbi:hypothetical protein RFI_22622 [Reticulomyxa filosa]|uniref:Uncharacterized protein n=1 Tax=Reticulomyxa filosa TaxID=46433 RepID=X6MNT5_RETFI|nr:hypothetical protein RFI_22622 [Reticulomyxa filosa]|eukprot:ETO14745.1 hypothetical protein RFI_22622 [Reticulomyxa filosa]
MDNSFGFTQLGAGAEKINKLSAFMTEEQEPTEKRLFTYLKNEVKLHDDYAAKLTSYLCREVKIGEVKDIALMEPSEWKKALTHTELASSSKKKLLKMVNKMREDESEKPLDIEEIIKEEPLYPPPQSKAQSNQPLQSYITIYFCVVILLLLLLLFDKSKESKKIKTKIKKSKFATFDINDGTWKGSGLRNGDEILCTYSFESNNNLKVDKIEFPVLYRSEIMEDNDSQFALVQLHCTQSVLFL